MASSREGWVKRRDTWHKSGFPKACSANIFQYKGEYRWMANCQKWKQSESRTYGPSGDYETQCVSEGKTRVLSEAKSRAAKALKYCRAKTGLNGLRRRRARR